MTHKRNVAVLLIAIAIVATAIVGLIANQSPLLLLHSASEVPTIASAPDAAQELELVNLRQKWLLEPACVPPCWQGLIPGKTTAEQAFTLLQNNPIVENVTRFENTKPKEIDWKWKNTKAGGGRLFISESGDGHIVYAILADLGCCFRLGDIIDKYGNPSSAIVSKYSTYENSGNATITVTEKYVALIAWIPQGFEVAGVVSTNQKLDANLKVYSPNFFVPTMDGYLAYEGNAVSGSLPWHGYDDLSAYLVPN